MLPSLLLLLSLLQPPGGPPVDLAHWTAHPLIAHAMGGINGEDLTNSSEAFEANYAKGFRVFETDLLPTTDNRLVARHDWDIKLFRKFAQDQYIPDLKEWNPISYEQFIELPIHNRYNAMAWTDLLKLMVDHPDIYFVLDTKYTDEISVRKQYEKVVDDAVQIDPALLDRIVPQLYNRPMLATIDSIHPFKSYIYTLYQSKDTERQVIDFVRANSRIDAVTMGDVRATKSFVQSLNQLGIRTYVHTVNSKQTFEKLRQKGVFGVYTDFLGYSELVKGKKGKWTAQAPKPTD